jgi:hypothetical protein
VTELTVTCTVIRVICWLDALLYRHNDAECNVGAPTKTAERSNGTSRKDHQVIDSNGKSTKTLVGSGFYVAADQQKKKHVMDILECAKHFMCVVIVKNEDVGAPTISIVRTHIAFEQEIRGAVGTIREEFHRAYFARLGRDLAAQTRSKWRRVEKRTRGIAALAGALR